jgi:uroporphyrinogen decarboxylase
LNDNFLNALQRTNANRYVPVWLLRQAGRYLPEYRKIRAKNEDFFAMIKKPEVCCELTLQPLRRFKLDAAITFTDILTIPDALGLEVEFVKNKGPVFKKSFLQNKSLRLDQTNFLDRLDYVFQATNLIKSNIDLPLIGFCGSPWTIFTYMFYGESPKNFAIIKDYISENIESTAETLDLLTQLSIVYLKEQAKYGADCLQIFDSWGGILGDDYVKYSLKYINEIRKELPHNIPIILYSRGQKVMEFLKDSDVKIFNFDSSEKLEKYIDLPLTVQGNLDPKVFNNSDQKLISLAEDIYLKFSQKNNYICNLGSGLTPDINPEKVGTFLNHLRFLNSQ